MQSPIVSRQGARLKPPGKRIAIAVALVVGAVLIGWTQRGVLDAPKPLELRSGETLTAREVILRQIIGTPSGAPPGFTCVMAYEVRPVDPGQQFSKDFRLNFVDVDASGLEVIRISNGSWERVDSSRPWLGKVELYVESRQPGVYALGRFP